MMNRNRIPFGAWSLALCAALALGGCAANAPGSSEMLAPSARLEVTNRSTFDMDVFLVRDEQRARLGLAPGGMTTKYTLSRAQITGGGMVRFLAAPIVTGRAVTTELLSLKPGDVVTLDIPPQ